uniref:BHLH domain-containing protein n=1 Tax=Neogobius melanostomus TaxID=47308 RepID=A0A8C6V4B8_9GOBI
NVCGTISDLVRHRNHLFEEMHSPRRDILRNNSFVARTFHGLSDHDAHCKDGSPVIDAAFLGHFYDQRFNYRRLSYFPFHGPISVFSPAFIRKRNERERHRVRCVNEGYARLQEHLPFENENKRLSKVETLRAAIGYIKHLQSLLELETGSKSSDNIKQIINVILCAVVGSI